MIQWNHEREVRDIKQLSIRLDEELLKQLKILTINQNTSIQKIVEEFLKSYVEQHQDNQK